MTEKDITQSINKHSIKPLLALILLILIVKVLNSYFFENDPISSTLIIISAIAVCLHTFKKVLVDLLINKSKTTQAE